MQTTSNELVCSARTWKFWTTSVPKTEEFFEGKEKGDVDLHRSIDAGKKFSKRSEN